MPIRFLAEVMVTAGPNPGALREQTRRAFSDLDDPHTPLTTTELAAQLGCPTHVASQTLESLADRGELLTRPIDDQTTLWWRPSTDTPPEERHPELQEFGAFVQAVEDYAIFMLDTNGVVISWNEGAERIKGYREGEIVGKHFSTFYTEEDVAAGVPAANLDAARVDHRVRDEGWRVRKDGSRFWADVVITAIRDDGGILQGFTKVTRDKTEQREYERELARESEQTEQLLRTAPVAIAVQDTSGKTVLANRRAQETLGLSEEEFVATSDDESKWELFDTAGEPIPPEQLPTARVLMTGEAVLGQEVTVSPPEGEERHLRVNAAPVFDETGDITRVITAGLDVTEVTQ